MTLSCQRAQCRDQREEGRGSPQAGKLGFTGQLEVLQVLAFSPLSAQPSDVGTVRAGMEHTEERSRELPCSWGAPEAAGKVACVQTCMQGQTLVRSLWEGM